MITWAALRGGPLATEYSGWLPDSRSRSAADGTLRIPPRPMLLMRSGVRIWNDNPAIREAKTRSTVYNLVEKIPLPV